MGWPQLVIIALSAMGVGINMAKHGEPRKGKFNFWIALSVAAIEMGLLYAGGFFG
ncbi:MULTISPECIES: hypothetical protein [unclassified Sinorhizobium]|uniref:hypothetical protein n=1 Tax=unclassified Sinorhizobium TaxID=2613772 RepID=UPI0035258814